MYLPDLTRHYSMVLAMILSFTKVATGQAL